MRNPFKRNDAGAPFDYHKETDVLAENYQLLLNRAGIVDEIARCESLREDDYFQDRHLPPLSTEARKRAEKRQDAEKFDAYRYCLRKVVFAVPDLGLRREIISCKRKFRELLLEKFSRDLWDAQRRANQVAKLGMGRVFTARRMG